MQRLINIIFQYKHVYIIPVQASLLRWIKVVTRFHTDNTVIRNIYGHNTLEVEHLSSAHNIDCSTLTNNS